MVQQAFQRLTSAPHLYFAHSELAEVLAVYVERVRKNEWRNYSIICAEKSTSFVVLDNGVDIASITKTDSGIFKLTYNNYKLETAEFSKALYYFKTDFNNKRSSSAILKIVP